MSMGSELVSSSANSRFDRTASILNMDYSLIEQEGIPDSGRRRVIEPESAEIELPLANAVHQLDA